MVDRHEGRNGRQCGDIAGELAPLAHLEPHWLRPGEMNANDGERSARSFDLSKAAEDEHACRARSVVESPGRPDKQTAEDQVAIVATLGIGRH